MEGFAKMMEGASLLKRWLDRHQAKLGGNTHAVECREQFPVSQRASVEVHRKIEMEEKVKIVSLFSFPITNQSEVVDRGALNPRGRV